MKNRLKMLLAALGAAALVVSQYGVFQVNAEESVDSDNNAAVTEAQADESADSSTSSTLLPATNLRWTENGEGVFYNPNEEAWFDVQVFYGDEYVGYYSDGWMYEKGDVSLDLYHLIQWYGKDGKYTFGVKAVYPDKEPAYSRLSPEFTYIRPDNHLPSPDASVSPDGVVSCKVNGYTLGEDYGFYYTVYEDNTPIMGWGNNYSSLDLNNYIDLKEGCCYTIYVQTLSRNLNKYLDSEEAALCILNLRTDDSPVPTVKWEPTAPEDKKRHEVLGKEKVEYTAENGNAYTVKVQNAVQGKNCFASFEAVLMDWNIGRTYNILPSGKAVYKMNEQTIISLSIPKGLQAEGRAFKMICVTEGGLAIVLDDLDSDPNTITFATDTFYAFALVYKDM